MREQAAATNMMQICGCYSGSVQGRTWGGSGTTTPGGRVQGEAKWMFWINKCDV